MAIPIKDFLAVLDKKQDEGFEALKATSVKDEKFAMILNNTMTCVNLETQIVREQQAQAVQAAQRAQQQAQAKKTENPKANKVFEVVEGGKKED